MKYRIFATYGIAATENGAVTESIPNISVSKRRIRKLCRLCNKQKLSPEHLRDVAEDFICV